MKNTIRKLVLTRNLRHIIGTGAAFALVLLTAPLARAVGGALSYQVFGSTGHEPILILSDSEFVFTGAADFGATLPTLTYPPTYHADAMAYANFERLRAAASVLGRAGSTAGAKASFRETFLCMPASSRLLGTRGHATVSMELTGVVAPTEPPDWGTSAEMDAQYKLLITKGADTNAEVVVNKRGLWVSRDSGGGPATFSGDPIPGPFTAEVPFTWGASFDLVGTLTVAAGCSGTPSGTLLGQATSDFSHTFTWLGVLAVHDEDGNLVTDYTLTAASGTDWTRGPASTANSPPVARAVNVIVPAGADCSAAASIDAGSSDPDGDAITLSQSPPGPYPVGTTTVTLTVTDSHGASSSATATVTVVDDQPPTIVCPPDLCVASDAGSCSASAVNLGTPQTSDNCSVASVLNNAPASFPLGVTTVTWTAADPTGNTATCQQKVTVLSSVSITWLPPLSGQPVANKIRAGQVVPEKVDLKDCMDSLPAGVTVRLKVDGIQQTALGDTVFQDVSEEANGTGLDGVVANDGIMLLRDGHYQFNLDTSNFSDPNTADETDKSYRSTVIVTDDATGCELGRSSVILETRN